MMRLGMLALLGGCVQPACGTNCPPDPPPRSYVLTELRNGDRSLLAFTLDRGISPPFSCRVQNEAAVGEIVEATVVVDGDPESTYELSILSEGDDVKLLDPPVHRVRGETQLPIRFTRTRPGQGGLRLMIQRTTAPASRLESEWSP